MHPAETTTGTLNYGKAVIDYELLRTDRKSVEIAVHPDKSIVVKAPLTAGLDTIQAHIRKKARWIRKQLAYFDQFDPRTPPRRYVGGESHLYLGRQYRLKIREPEQGQQQEQVLLQNGYFIINTVRNDPTHIKTLMDAWYQEKAQTHLTQIFQDCWDGFNRNRLQQQPTLKLQHLEKRWGSLSKSGRLTLNLRLIQTPPECIEYVIIHELCHLLHHHHGPEFYALLERTLPDWAVRKRKLEAALA